jgi:hypothetical protein
VADEDRHAHAGRGQLDLGVEDLLGLDHHLPLFLGEAVIKENVDMRDHVEGDLLGELLGIRLIAHEDAAALLEQLVHAFLARARHRLISGDDDALDGGGIVQGLSVTTSCAVEQLGLAMMFFLA